MAIGYPHLSTVRHPLKQTKTSTHRYLQLTCLVEFRLTNFAHLSTTEKNNAPRTTERSARLGVGFGQGQHEVPELFIRDHPLLSTRLLRRPLWKPKWDPQRKWIVNDPIDGKIEKWPIQLMIYRCWCYWCSKRNQMVQDDDDETSHVKPNDGIQWLHYNESQAMSRWCDHWIPGP